MATGSANASDSASSEPAAGLNFLMVIAGICSDLLIYYVVSS